MLEKIKTDLDFINSVGIRYLIVGTFAMHLHGFYWNEGDIDIWLDPEVPDSCKQTMHDVMYGNQSSGLITFCTPEGLDSFDHCYYNESLNSPYGKFLKIKKAIKSKMAAQRVKDYRYIFGVVTDLLLEDRDLPWKPL